MIVAGVVVTDIVVVAIGAEIDAIHYAVADIVAQNGVVGRKDFDAEQPITADFVVYNFALI